MQIGSELQQEGHYVEIMCARTVQSPIVHGVITRDWIHGFAVSRIGVSLVERSIYSPISVEDNGLTPVFRQVIDAITPDVVHVLQHTLLTTSIYTATEQKNIPTVYTATTYEVVCARNNFVRFDGSNCDAIQGFVKCIDCLRHRSHAANVMMRMLYHANNAQWRSLQRRINMLLRKRVGLLDLGATQALRLKATLQVSERVQQTIAPSFWVRDLLVKNGFEPGRISVIPHGIQITSDQHRANLNTSRASSESWKPALRIGYIGRLHPSKGVHILIQSVRLLPRPVQVFLDIFGGASPYDSVYEQQLHSLATGDERIRFHGWVSEVDIADAYESVDVVVVPSVWYEVYGLVVLEAIAHRVPVIASAIGGLSEVVTSHRAGWLVPPGDPQAIADLIARLYQNPKMIADAISKLAEPRTSSEEARDLLQVYHRIIGDAPRG